MKAVVFVLLAVIFHIGSPAALSSCPKFCKCEHPTDISSIKCSSLKFLHKLSENQANQIHDLDLSNISLTVLDKRLKKLTNLEILKLDNNELHNLQYFPNLPKLKKLSLVNNQIKSLSFSILPKGIEELDISSNFIVELPKDWDVLHRLNQLHIHNNPVKCDESSVNKYVNLVSSKVKISENVVCQYPKEVAGKILQSLIAESLLNPMLGDQEEQNENVEEVGNEFIKHTTEDSEKSVKFQEDLFEGSGDEGSGFSEKEIPSACVIDCTTFQPLQILKQNNSSPLLSIKEQVGILFEDLFGKEQDTPTTTTTPIPIASENSSPIVKESVTLSESSKTTKMTEKLAVSATKSKETDGLERASIGGDQDGYTYYLIATVLVVMVLVAVFLIIKKRSFQARRKRKRNSMAENGICEEMKPLGKYKEISNGTEKPKEEAARPEIIPLMNGQNGKSGSVKDSLEDLDVTLRTPSDSPKPERVTITSGEIPPSVLRTPQLVHRQLTSDGEIITKPLDDSY